MGAKIGAAAWGFREMPLHTQLKICKEIGCLYLELGIANAPGDIQLNATKEELGIIRELYKKYEIQLLCAATGNDFTLDNVKEVMAQIEKIKKVIDICQELEISYLRIFAGFSHVDKIKQDRWKYMIYAINEVAGYAKDKGVILAIETHGGVDSFSDGVKHYASVSTEVESLKQMLKEIDKEVCFVLDPANLAAVGHQNIREQYELIQNRIVYEHIKNFKILPSGHLEPSSAESGIFNWVDFLKEKPDKDGIYLVEYENPKNVEEGTKESVESLRKWGI